MVELTVAKGFYDNLGRTHRRVGDTFEATEERAAQIEAKLPGYTTAKPKPRARRTKKES